MSKSLNKLMPGEWLQNVGNIQQHVKRDRHHGAWPVKSERVYGRRGRKTSPPLWLALPRRGWASRLVARFGRLLLAGLALAAAAAICASAGRPCCCCCWGCSPPRFAAAAAAASRSADGLGHRNLGTAPSTGPNGDCCTCICSWGAWEGEKGLEISFLWF